MMLVDKVHLTCHHVSLYNYFVLFCLHLQPVLDIVIYIRQLALAIGAQGPATMIGYLAVAGLILTRYVKLFMWGWGRGSGKGLNKEESV